MARGASQSQTTSSSSSSRAGVAAPRGSAAATAGMRRRRVLSSGSSSGGGSGSGIGAPGGNMLRFYTDDTPGLKISPTIVLVISLCFIGFVTALHVFGKLYRSKVSPWAYNPNKKKDRFLFRIFDSAVECVVSLFFFDVSVNNHGRKKVADSFVSFPLDSIVTFKVTFLFYFMYLFMGLIFLINCFWQLI